VLPAIREFGAPDGHPLLFIHGWPGSSRQGVLLDAAAKEHGFRVLSPDRPGIGESPLAPGRTLLDWPQLVRGIAAQFHCPRLAVLGLSGGGPYALACASALPDLVCAASIVCGAPPIAELRHSSGLHPAYRLLLRLFRLSPRLVHALFQAARPLMFWSDAARFLPPLRIVLPQPDADALSDPHNFATVFECQRDAFRNVDGLFDDAALYTRPWGFAPEEIHIPVQFWHGREDANFHFTLAESLAGRIPSAALRIVEGEGHFSLPIRRAEPILAALATVC
jgi:pimeloyl-ACP methyl ester carboxylesterase